MWAKFEALVPKQSLHPACVPDMILATTSKEDFDVAALSVQHTLLEESMSDLAKGLRLQQDQVKSGGAAAAAMVPNSSLALADRLSVDSSPVGRELLAQADGLNGTDESVSKSRLKNLDESAELERDLGYLAGTVAQIASDGHLSPRVHNELQASNQALQFAGHWQDQVTERLQQTGFGTSTSATLIHSSQDLSKVIAGDTAQTPSFDPEKPYPKGGADVSSAGKDLGDRLQGLQRVIADDDYLLSSALTSQGLAQDQVRSSEGHVKTAGKQN